MLCYFAAEQRKVVACLLSDESINSCLGISTCLDVLGQLSLTQNSLHSLMEEIDMIIAGAMGDCQPLSGSSLGRLLSTTVSG